MTVRQGPVALTCAALIALAACGTSQGTPAPRASQLAASTAPTPSGSAEPSASATPEATPSPTATPEPTPSATAAPTPSAEPTVEPVYQHIEDVEVGECFRAINDADDGAILAAGIVDCEQPHDAELFAIELVEGAPDAPYPGDEELDEPAIELCDAAFEAYVGVAYDHSVYDYAYFTPSEETWLAGDREVLCVIEHKGEMAEGSVRGSNS